MEQLINSMKISIDLLEETASLLYQQKQQDGMKKLEQTISVIMDMLEVVQYYRKDQPTIIFEEVNFNQALTNALDVLAQRDYVLLADLLTFELSVIIREALNELQNYSNN